MNATELATLSMTELKSMCASHVIDVIGDKRSKATYISAIESFQSLQTVTDFATEQSLAKPLRMRIDLPLTEAAEMAERSTTPLELYMEIDGSTSTPLPTDLPTVPANHHGASIVVLIPLILLSVAVIAIRIGMGTLIPLIASLKRFTGSIWGSIPRLIDTSSILIDYFPSLA
jgi:hypothetical protein